MRRIMVCLQGIGRRRCRSVSPMAQPSRFRLACVLARRHGGSLSRPSWGCRVGPAACGQRARDTEVRAVCLAGGNPALWRACGLDQDFKIARRVPADAA